MKKKDDIKGERPPEQIKILETGIENVVSHLLDAYLEAQREGRDIDEALAEANAQIVTRNAFRPS